MFSTIARLATVTLVWLIAAGATAAEPQGLRSAIAEHFHAQAERSNRLYGARIPPIDPSSYDFAYVLPDLNGDGIPDAVVLLKGNYCGSGGCALQIFRGAGSGFQFLGSSPAVNEPIRVLHQASHGWKTLVVARRDEGDALFVFDGRRYALSNTKTRRSRLDTAEMLTFGQ